MPCQQHLNAKVSSHVTQICYTKRSRMKIHPYMRTQFAYRTTKSPLYSPSKLGTFTMPFSCHSRALHMRSISSSDPNTLMEFSVSSSLLSSLIWNSSTRSPDLQ
mmetsp:Transcript_13842/g.32336  ORF Transcript_13842/g.32336 Transcript_13842/m.32336 type:complete len:104 (+) Transcript_13842:4213-4524(+)